MQIHFFSVLSDRRNAHNNALEIMILHLEYDPR